ncbi:hypothetical protein CTAYLR_002803 [Chrysophaeum taylorii]|uniref:Aspartyl/asparaginy/proline hydroxylase domain-containing protein n=1 Tax=Chrysophaeum taylorii TaxID=2483200 RepID=A0AAD7XG12_9STRA|nr:hypothetical protein CTAYLR_002803 [Chrysophaeum taylorii]
MNPTDKFAVMLVLLPAAGALSLGYSTSVYYNQRSQSLGLDEAAFGSPKFWADVDRNIPGWQSELERFRGFCENLRTKPPGKDVFLANGQQVLAQYVYPGIDDKDGSTPPRRAYPADDYLELRELRERLEHDVAPVAQRELRTLLEARPLVDDDDSRDDSGDTWHRAAWYGWQFMSLRGARQWMPETASALRAAMGGARRLGPAHRFVGLARQKARCRGLSHSDGRNYMLSTLTPVAAPTGKCGIVVNGTSAPIATGGPAVILDNTFPHHVYNDADEDRFCIIAEHPALAPVEREALATLFALKDRFTVLELQLAPWGYNDDDLGAALRSGAVYGLDYWKEIGRAPDDRRASPSALTKKRRSRGKGFGGKRTATR